MHKDGKKLFEKFSRNGVQGAEYDLVGDESTRFLMLSIESGQNSARESSVMEPVKQQW